MHIVLYVNMHNTQDCLTPRTMSWRYSRATSWSWATWRCSRPRSGRACATSGGCPTAPSRYAHGYAKDRRARLWKHDTRVRRPYGTGQTCLSERAMWWWCQTSTSQAKGYWDVSVSFRDICVPHLHDGFHWRGRSYSTDLRKCRPCVLFRHVECFLHTLHKQHILFIFAYFCIFCHIMYISAYWVLHGQQPSFRAEDVPYRTLTTMSKDILQKMMPGVEVYEADMHEGIQICPWLL